MCSYWRRPGDYFFGGGSKIWRHGENRRLSTKLINYRWIIAVLISSMCQVTIVEDAKGRVLFPSVVAFLENGEGECECAVGGRKCLYDV